MDMCRSRDVHGGCVYDVSVCGGRMPRRTLDFAGHCVFGILSDFPRSRRCVHVALSGNFLEKSQQTSKAVSCFKEKLHIEKPSGCQRRVSVDNRSAF